MPLLVKIVRLLAGSWLALAGIVFLLRFAATWYSEGFGALQELLSPYNVRNFVAIIIIFAPGVALFWLAEAIEGRRWSAALGALLALALSVGLVAAMIFLPVLAEKLEKRYFDRLDSWVSRGGPKEEAQTQVVETCGKLVMLDATAWQKITFTTTEREEFHFRVDVCLKVAANRVYPQPPLQKPEMVKMICNSPIVLFRKLCKWGLTQP